MRTNLTYNDRKGKPQPLDLAGVLYFQSGDKYVTAFHESGEYLLNDRLSDLEQEFAAEFIRTHRSTLVRRSEIISMRRKLDDKAGYLRVRGVENELPVSRRRIDNVVQYMKSRESE